MSSEIVRALVGLKDVQVLELSRHGPEVHLMIEQVLAEVCCPACGGRALVKERPVAIYSDLPVYGVPMHLAWKKHRMRCPDPTCPYTGWRVAMLIDGHDIEIVGLDGSPLRRLVLDPTKDYQRIP